MEIVKLACKTSLGNLKHFMSCQNMILVVEISEFEINVVQV
jgi:hypothetical protein